MIGSFQGQYRFLSNFYPCTITGWHGNVYHSAEAMYQAAKCLTEDGISWSIPVVEERIRYAPSPGKAKRIGWEQTRPLPLYWDAVRVERMRQVQFAKYSQNADLKALLLATGNEELQEGNTWGDTFWGVSCGVGQNWMGRILMDLRATL